MSERELNITLAERPANSYSSHQVPQKKAQIKIQAVPAEIDHRMKSWFQFSMVCCLPIKVLSTCVCKAYIRVARLVFYEGQIWRKRYFVGPGRVFRRI